MNRYLITFSYDGTLFNGYQKQPKVRTVQGEIEAALKKINNNNTVSITASGRTDSGVHALNQKAHFDIDVNVTLSKLKRALNSLVSSDVFIKEVVIVDNEFHARYNVKSKEYMYKINMGEYDPIERNYVYQHNRTLNLVEIRKALKHLEGEHNYKAFSKTNADKEEDDYIRFIAKAELIIDKADDNKVTILFTGTGFFRYMVRNMVGTLIEIGEGRKKSEDITTILTSKDRIKAGKTANPEGLYLNNVVY